MTAPDPGYLPCLFLFSQEPTDRALDGWCPVPTRLVSEHAARLYVAAQASTGGALFGDTRT